MDVAEFGLKLNADGFVQSAGRAGRALEDLGGHATRTGVKTERFASSAAFAVAGMAQGVNRDITSVLHSMTNLGFAFGTGVGSIVLVISAIADAWNDAHKQSGEAQQKMIADLQRFEKEYTASQLRMRIATIERLRDEQLGKVGGIGGPAGSINTVSKVSELLFGHEQSKAINAASKAASDYNDHLGELYAQLVKVSGVESKDAVKAAKDLAKAHGEAYSKDLEEAKRRYIQHLVDEYDLTEKIRKMGGEDAAREQHEADEQRKRDLDEILFRHREEIEAMDKKIQKAKQLHDMMGGAVTGAMGGIFSGMGGAVGGGANGAIGAIMAGAGPAGIAVGLFSGIVGGLLSMDDASNQAEAELVSMRLQVEGFSDDLKVLAGTMGGAEAKLNAIHREFTQLRGGLSTEEYDKFIASLKGLGVNLDATRQRADLLKQTEAARVAILQEEIRVLNETMQGDLEVRRLRAVGETDLADAMDLALKQQREYNDAVKAGADATTLAALSETQRVERIAIAMQKIQARIDSLSNTINGLQDFRNSLLLSDATSPTKQLAEAKRQYLDILKAAQGGDQTAAGRLPAAAQAFLEFSRAVNASGAGFQADFAKVLKDTQDLIDAFTDQRSVEELMLDELKKISGSLGRIVEGPTGPITGLTPTGAITASNTATVTVLQAGFTQVVARLGAVELAIEDGFTSNKRALEAIHL